MGETLHGPYPIDATFTIAQELEIIGNLWHLIPERLHDQIRTTYRANEPDKLIFTRSNHGTFSTKEFWEFSRPRGVAPTWASWIWNPCLPPNIWAFLWRLIRHALHVDNKIQAKGILLASLCRCCQEHHVETLVHLFLQSEIATAVWKCFGELFHLLYTFGSILQSMSIWMSTTSSSSHYGVCRLGVTAYILRKIWVSRCHANFEGTRMSARQVCLKVMFRVQLLSIGSVPKNMTSGPQSIVLSTMGISRQSVRTKKGRWCKWDKPSPGRYKLNIDRSARGEVATGGGIVRNHEGDVVTGFSNFYGHGSNNLAELMALRDGL